ncbi:MAG: monovalent cation/H+ antiporter subunit D family protein [Ectothiorhodospiraceae bacterium]|jgi:multicomponent Na+:H+ antiporter subunit D
MSIEATLNLALLIPLVGVAGIVLTANRPNLRETVTLITAAALLLCVLRVLPPVLAGGRPEVTWFTMLPGIPLGLRVEPLGMLFSLIASLLWIVNSIYSIGYMRGNQEKHQTRFYVCFAIAIFSAVGLAWSANLATLFIFYEVLTLSTYPLVTHKGNEEALRGGRTYLGILLGTSIGLFLLAILWTWQAAGTLEFVPGGILAGHLTGALVGVLLALYMYGIGKAALMPIHRWLPAAMVAPTPVSALLHAVAVVKAGVFTVVKVIVYVFGTQLLLAESSADWLVYAAGITILFASFVALRQDNLKRRLAYSTISQLSYVIMSAALFTPAAIMGAALHIAAHAFGKITLFFAAGSIYTAAHKSNVSELDGVGRQMPWTMTAFAIGSLSMIGVPPTAGFISKWFIISGGLAAEHVFALTVVCVSTILNAGYFLPIVYRAFFRRDEAQARHGEAPLPIVIAVTATALLTLLMFIAPGLPLALARGVVGGAG